MRLLSLCYWGFYVLLLKPCAPDPGDRQGGDCLVAGCTGGCRYDSLLCDRWGIVDLFEPANTALLWSLFFKTSYPVSCMYVRDFIVILLNTCYYICIYVSWRFLTKFYDMCNPEILCNCLFYLLFTCTLSEMMNKRCPIYTPAESTGYIAPGTAWNVIWVLLKNIYHHLILHRKQIWCLSAKQINFVL